VAGGRRSYRDRWASKLHAGERTRPFGPVFPRLARRGAVGPKRHRIIRSIALAGGLVRVQIRVIILHMHVSRARLTAQVTALLDDFPVVALLGPRQCGKTTLARQITAERTPAGTYLDLERPRDLVRLTDPDLYLSAYEDRLVCLDEVQRMPALYPVLRSLIDDAPRPGRFLLLGSASPGLVQHGSESLAGRLATVALTPFTCDEVVSEMVDLQTHWLRGGYPLSVLARNEAVSRRWREEFVRTFLERDLGQLGVRTTPDSMGRFWRMMAHHHGQVLNASALANSLDVSQPTVRARIDEMVGVYMLRVLPPLTANLGTVPPARPSCGPVVHRRGPLPPQPGACTPRGSRRLWILPEADEEAILLLDEI
jgi:predicted AAA+ superfamily ATPase